jgi:hypothetical protein
MAGQPGRYDFCTLFDRRYLARGLVLYRSLEEHCSDFQLHIICADPETRAALAALDLPRAVLVPIAELEDAHPELAAVRPTRTRTEYYWTATPATCLFVLERNPHLRQLVRVDADLRFYADPTPLFDELGDGSVLLMPHRVAPEFRGATEEQQRFLGGRFNVQFEVFRHDERGLSALRWWHERCIEWCYSRVEPGRFGDQAYLDDWETRFRGVRACSHPGAGLAPWNIGRYALEAPSGGLRVDGEPVIFHHFQSLEVHRASLAGGAVAHLSRAYRKVDGPVPLVWTAGWRLTDQQLNLLWDPYVEELSAAYGDLVQASSFPALAPLRANVAAFHVLRRRLPVRLRNRYWRGRNALRMRRKRRVPPVQVDP